MKVKNTVSGGGHRATRPAGCTRLNVRHLRNTISRALIAREHATVHDRAAHSLDDLRHSTFGKLCGFKHIVYLIDQEMLANSRVYFCNRRVSQIVYRKSRATLQYSRNGENRYRYTIWDSPLSLAGHPWVDACSRASKVLRSSPANVMYAEESVKLQRSI